MGRVDGFAGPAQYPPRFRLAVVTPGNERDRRVSESSGCWDAPDDHPRLSGLFWSSFPTWECESMSACPTACAKRSLLQMARITSQYWRFTLPDRRDQSPSRMLGYPIHVDPAAIFHDLISPAYSLKTRKMAPTPRSMPGRCDDVGGESPAVYQSDRSLSFFSEPSNVRTPALTRIPSLKFPIPDLLNANTRYLRLEDSVGKCMRVMTNTHARPSRLFRMISL